jgi:hypothetical protein
MPSSVFVSQALMHSERLAPPAVAARQFLLGSHSGYTAPGPTTADTCYVWPSASCPVGCGHCNFAAPSRADGLDRYRIARNLDRVMTIVNGMGLWKAVLSGGGEPMVEPEFCQRFINAVDSPSLAEIEVITSGHFAVDAAAARRELEALAAAWRDRPANIATTALTIRLSLDWFHVQRLGLGHAVSLIDILGLADFSDVGFYIRSVLLDRDDTGMRLAGATGGKLSPLVDYQRELLLPDGRSILIYYKNLILDGRMTERKLGRLPVAIPQASRVEEFVTRFLDDRGRHVPARLYNGPTVRRLEGLACVVEDDGAIKILEGNAPDRAPTVESVACWDEAIGFFYADPLTVFLVEHGPQALAELIADRYPAAIRVVSDTNQLYYLTERILGRPEQAFYATFRVLARHVAEGRTTVAAGALSRAEELVEQLCPAPEQRK